MTEYSNFPVVCEGRVGEEQIQTVNARDLHAFLEAKKDFSNWIKDRIEQYGFAENLDFVVFAEIGENPSGGRPRREYAISLDMAKELAMVERNDKGKQARQYFIECERRTKQIDAQPKIIDLNDPSMLRGLLSNYAERVERVEAELIEALPKVEAFERLDTCEGAMVVRAASKTLGYPERKLSKWLEVNGWAFRQSGKGPLQAYAQRRKDGFLDQKLRYFNDPKTGVERVDATLTITPKGMARLAKVLPIGGAA